jgi:hypothetical protein
MVSISFKQAIILWVLFAFVTVYLDVGGEFDFIKYNSEHNIDQAQEVKRTSLNVEATPTNSKIRIMNIGPKYLPGMLLDNGQYDIEVSSPGYQTQRRWVVLNEKKKKHYFSLTKK